MRNCPFLKKIPELVKRYPIYPTILGILINAIPTLFVEYSSWTQFLLVVGTGIIIYSLSVLQKNLTELEALTKTMKQIIDNKSIVMKDEKLSIGEVDCGTF